MSQHSLLFESIVSLIFLVDVGFLLYASRYCKYSFLATFKFRYGRLDFFIVESLVVFDFNKVFINTFGERTNDFLERLADVLSALRFCHYVIFGLDVESLVETLHVVVVEHQLIQVFVYLQLYVSVDFGKESQFFYLEMPHLVPDVLYEIKSEFQEHILPLNVYFVVLQTFVRW